MAIAVTGSDGFLGRHLRVRLKAGGLPLVRITRAELADEQRLSHIFSSTNVNTVVHLAGINRGDPAAVEEGNAELAERLVASLAKSDRPLRVLFANSVHAGADTPYGRGKQRASEALAMWAEKAGAPYVDLVLPNLFGECGRPNYNSFVATFCHGLAKGAKPTVEVDRELDLLHAQDAADVIVTYLQCDAMAGAVRPTGRRTTVNEVRDRLEAIAARYPSVKFPDLEDTFNLQLFNTYRSYLYPDRFPVLLEGHRDARGEFFEAVQALGGSSQASFSITKPGVTRGNHFHLRKVERFVVLRGLARISMRPCWEDPTHTFSVTGQEPALVDMPTLFTHNITNIGEEELITLFWTNEVFDPDNPDTFPEPV
jgi:UDP-2-acetamido-2,6-beta-L-arabino-hexul-4-ose reductase